MGTWRKLKKLSRESEIIMHILNNPPGKYNGVVELLEDEMDQKENLLLDRVWDKLSTVYKCFSEIWNNDEDEDEK